MALRDVTGDLLTIAARNEAIGHGCNRHGAMGGLAGLVERRWPGCAAAYRDAIAADAFPLGGVLPWRDPASGVWIYNLATQEWPGPDARLDAIEASVRAALDHAAVNEVPRLYLPQIGAGIGGLAWSDVRGVLAAIAATSSVDVVAVSLP